MERQKKRKKWKASNMGNKFSEAVEGSPAFEEGIFQNVFWTRLCPRASSYTEYVCSAHPWFFSSRRGTFFSEVSKRTLLEMHHASITGKSGPAISA